MMEKKQTATNLPATPTHDRERDARTALTPNENERLFRTRWNAIESAYMDAHGLTGGHHRGARHTGIFR